ncbi:MAG: diguanylate cyclase [candidate division WOR-3 bacterium]|nr:MAG: diguanylate cyclase [candidate division WOR-3 bacterium]
MGRYIKLGYEGIELELPVHALYIYRDTEQLLSNIVPLITEGVEHKEKCIFIGKKEDCKVLKKKFKTGITILGDGIGAGDFLPWLKSEYGKLGKSYQGLRIFLESEKEFLHYEDIIDDFHTQPDLKLFLLCQYKIDEVDTSQMLDILKTHPYVFVEHLLKPNCFYSRVKHRIWLDPLTGIFNRRYFENQLSKELQRASRYTHPLSILFLDIDQFKKVNDEFGHQRGDQVLQELCQILERCLRSVDVVARYGGDEFIALLPETKKTYAKKTAERILKSIKNYDFFKGNLKVRELAVSIGVAAFPEDAGGTYELIKKADTALYQAKREGGGKVVACT